MSKNKNSFKKYWQKAKPSLKVFGSVTWKLTKLGLVFALAAVIGGGGIAAGAVAAVFKDIPDFDPEALERPLLPSYIYDINGDLITEIHDEQNRIPITMADVPEHLMYAILAAEDNNFFEHSGFDLRGIARAAYTNIVDPNRVEGASTLTQQLVKQVFLTKDRKMTRKLQELYIAMAVERQYTKEEIFEFYINNATYFGNSAYGVEAAAQTYFGKSASELTLAESALIAGIPNSPNYFAPREEDLEPALRRRNDVLVRMRRFGYITQEEYDAAREEEIVLAPRPQRAWPWPHYTDVVVHRYAVSALVSLGYSDSEAAIAIRRDGLHIHTALDPKIQKVVQDVAFDDKYFPVNTFVYPEGHSNAGRRYPQGAAIVMDAKNGYVYGMVGGREWDRSNRINRGYYDFTRQPGSAIKPVLVYGPAFELNLLSPASVLDDAPTLWPGATEDRPYAPENVSRNFKGLVTVRNALVASDNIPAVKAYEMLMRAHGGRAGFDFAQSLGLYRNWRQGSRYTELGSALGSHEVSPLAMTEAYSAFANKGVASEAIFVTKIIDRNGNEIFSATPKQEVVMSEQTSFLMTNVLRDVITRGTGTPARLSNYNVAAKTGTTNSAHDRWVVGYSANYVFTVWMGNDNHQVTIDGKPHTIPGTSSAYTLVNQMFGDIVRGTIGNNDVPFPGAPSGLTRVEVCTKSGLLPTEFCDTTTDWFKTSNVPTQECDIHVIKRVCTDHGLLATEHCPEDKVVSKVFLNRDEVEPTDERWSGAVGRLPADYHLRPPTEYCYHHGPSYNFSGNIDGNSVRLTWEWKNQTDDEGNSLFNGFNIYRVAFGAQTKINSELIPINQSNFNDNARNLAPGVHYEYRLVLVDADGKEVSRHQPISLVKPLGITLNAEPHSNGIRITWNRPGDIPSSVKLEGYKLYRGDTQLGSLISGTNFVDENVPLGKHQYLLVTVYSSNGQQIESVPVTREVEVKNDNGGGNDDDDENSDENDNGDTARINSMRA